MTLVQIKNDTSTEYAQIVLCRKGAEFQPSRLTRPSDTPALQLGFIPEHLTGKPAQRITHHLNYPEIEIIGARPVIKTPHKPERTPPSPTKSELTSPREESAEGEQAWRRKYRTLDHRRLSQRSSAVLNMAHQFERSEESALSKSVSLTRLASKEIARKPARRTSVKEMAQLYNTMARDNSLDQLTQRDNSLSRSTSYIRNRALQQMTSDLTPIDSTPSSTRGSPQPYMNVSLSPPTSALYENAGLLKRADPYEEVFFSRPNSQLQFRYQKIPETGELIPSDSSLSASSSHASQLEQFAEPTNLRADFSQSADLISEHTCQKLRATTIATVEREEEFSEELLGHFFLTYHWTEPAEGYTDITSKASRRLSRGQVSRGERVEASVYRTHVSLSGSSGLPPSLLLMDLIAFQTDADQPDNLGMLVRAGTEFQLLFFSAPDSQSADQLIARLRDAASDCDRRASLLSSGSDDHFALLLGCSPVSSGAGKVSLGVEQTLSSHRLSQSQQVRIDLQDGFQIFPFGRSESLCAYRRQQVKSAGVWERDPRVLGVVLQQRAGRHICYTLRFNRVNQLLASFSRIRHLCREDAAEESKKQRAGFLNLKGLFGKQTVKPRCHSDTSRSSTPPVDQMDPDAFTLLFLGATEPDNTLLTPECVLREYKNLLAGINVAENVSPAPTTILTVSESCIRLTDKDKALFRRRVYQRRTVVACERAEGENVLALLTQRPGTDEKKCSLFRPVFSEAGLVSTHICQRLELKALH